MRSGWISSGPRVQQFEEAFALSLDSGLHAVAVSSATAGLHLSLESLGVGPGDEVIVPSWTFTATAEVVRYLGAQPVLVDVDDDTLNIDLTRAADAITSRTRAVLPVHFAGLAVDPSALRNFATTFDIPVVEDAAHAYPSIRAGVPVGAGASEASVFSFYATKPITTGEGGMIVTRDVNIARRSRMMRLHGISRDTFDRYQSSSGRWRYEVLAPGYKYNMTDTAAAMGLVQLGRAGEMRQRRSAIADYYRRELSDLPIRLPAPGGPEDTHSWHLFVIRTPSEPERDRLISGLSRLGIGTSVHFIPLHLQPAWGSYDQIGNNTFPVSTQAFSGVVSLPLYSKMTDGDAERVADGVKAVLKT